MAGKQWLHNGMYKQNINYVASHNETYLLIELVCFLTEKARLEASNIHQIHN